MKIKEIKDFVLPFINLISYKISGVLRLDKDEGSRLERRLTGPRRRCNYKYFCMGKTIQHISRSYKLGIAAFVKQLYHNHIVNMCGINPRLNMIPNRVHFSKVLELFHSKFGVKLFRRCASIYIRYDAKSKTTHERI